MTILRLKVDLSKYFKSFYQRKCHFLWYLNKFRIKYKCLNYIYLLLMIDEFYKVLRTPKPSITHTLGKTQDMVFSQSFRFYEPLNKFFPKHLMFNPSIKFMNKF